MKGAWPKCMAALLLLAAGACFGMAASQSAQLHTPGEQAVRLLEFEQRRATTSPPSGRADPIALIEREIRAAQRGEPYFRRPVPADRIAALQARLEALTGRSWPRAHVLAATDVAHAHLRESPRLSGAGYRERLSRGAQVQRLAFHGQVAEFAEARARGMVLTRSNRSQTYDLTETRQRPRSLQVKITQDPGTGLRSLEADLRGAHPRARHGVITPDAIHRLVADGRLRSAGHAGGETVFRTNSGSRVTVLPSRTMPSAAASQNYTRLGRATLAMMSRADTAQTASAYGLGALGVAVAPFVLWEARAAGLEAWELFQIDSARDTGLPYLYSGIALGRTAEAGMLLTMSLGQLGLIGGDSLQLLGYGGAELFLPLALSVQGLIAGKALYEYSIGRFSRREMEKQVAGPALALAFSSTGAVLGSVVPVFGTSAGAVGGFMLSVPVSFFVTRTMASYDREFQEEIRRVRKDTYLEGIEHRLTLVTAQGSDR